MGIKNSVANTPILPANAITHTKVEPYNSKVHPTKKISDSSRKILGKGIICTISKKNSVSNAPVLPANPITQTLVEPYNPGDHLIKHTSHRPASIFGQGMVLALLCLGFATVVAISTYFLTSIANTPVYFGTVMKAFTHDQLHVPVTTLMQASGTLSMSFASTNSTISLNTLGTMKCGDVDPTCVASLVPDAERAWYQVGKAFTLIPDFDLPIFQDASQLIKFQHINNLNGANTPMAQFYIDGQAMAITCMVRPASFYLQQQAATTAVTDYLAFCSKRAYDANWMCENDVDASVNTYVIQMNKGVGSFLGWSKRGQLYMNAGHVAQLTGSVSGNYMIQTVPAVSEFQSGIIQSSAPWDILAASQCGTYNAQTKSGWLLQLQGVVTMTWQCDSLMLTNSIVLWCMVFYLVTLQNIFLYRSAICYVPVYMSKNFVGLIVLGVAFYGNEHLQALTTFLSQNQVDGFPSMFYALCGPAQVASIVGIMTGTLVQIWFNPIIVTQTWLLLIFSSINWIVVFVLEGFVFPHQNSIVPKTCTLSSSTICFEYSAISKTYYISAIVSAGIVIIAIMTIAIHSRYWPSTINVRPDNSALQYLNIRDFSSVATSTRGCICVDENGVPGIDEGVLLIKNMLHVSNTVMTRSANVQYELVFRFLPFFLKKYFSYTVGSIFVYKVDGTKITPRFHHLYLHEMDIGHMDNVTGYII